MNVLSSLPLDLPSRTVRLFARYWLPLVVWYLLGNGVHDLLLEAAAHANRHNAVLGFSILSMAILSLITGYVMMFHTVQPGLPTVHGLQRRQRRGMSDHLRSLGVAILPFLLIYAAWDQFQDDVRKMAYRTWEINPIEASPQLAEFTLWFAGAAVIAWVVVKIMEGVTRRTGNAVTAALAAVFESLWMFFGLYGLGKLRDAGLAWLHNTLAWHNLAEFWSFGHGVAPVLPFRFHDVLDLSFGWLAFAKEPLFDGITLPLAWLAICGVCYGREMEDVNHLVDRRRFARVADRLERAPGVLKRHAGRFPPEGFREKYYPPLHAIFLMLAASIPAFLFFCVLYSAIEVGEAVLRQAVTTTMGAHSAGTFWQEVEPVLLKAIRLITEPLRICLLAVTFDLGLSKFTARRTAVDAPPQASETGEVPAGAR